jgi:hypothetical protein
MRTYARMRRLRSSVRVGVCVRGSVRDGGGARGGRCKGATFHLGITVHMHIIICTRARMYTCMPALVERISACVGVGACECARAAGAAVHSGCHHVYVCMLCMHACMYVRMYVCRYVCMHRLPFECARVRVSARVRAGAHSRFERATA